MNTVDMAFLSGKKDKPEKAPFGLTVAAIYLIVAAGISIIFLILNLNPSEGMPEWSFAQKAGICTRQIIFAILFLISGIGILKKKFWARKVAIWTIPITTIFSIYSSACGWSYSIYELLIVSVFTFGWNGIWFYLIFRKSSKDYLSQETSQAATTALSSPCGPGG